MDVDLVNTHNVAFIILTHYQNESREERRKYKDSVSF